MATQNGTILYGMMGCGKSTLGSGLAEHLRQPFVDTDELITLRSGRTPAEIVADPFANFADEQRAAVGLFNPEQPTVVATGGSVAMYEDLVVHLGQFGLSVYIDVDPEALQERLAPERIAALNNPDNLSFVDLCARRAEAYNAAADLTLSIPVGEPENVSLQRLIEIRS